MAHKFGKHIYLSLQNRFSLFIYMILCLVFMAQWTNGLIKRLHFDLGRVRVERLRTYWKFFFNLNKQITQLPLWDIRVQTKNHLVNLIFGTFHEFSFLISNVLFTFDLYLMIFCSTEHVCVCMFAFLFENINLKLSDAYESREIWVK